MFELIAKIFCAVVIARTSASMAIATVSRFYLGDSHVASLLGMTFGAVAIIATPFEQFATIILRVSPLLQTQSKRSS